MRTFMPTLCLCLAMLFATFSLFARDSFEGKPYRTENFVLKDEGKLQVETSGGSIAVLGEDSDEVTVEMFVKKQNSWKDWFSDEGVEEALQDYTIDIEQHGNKISAIAKKKRGNWGSNSLSISFRITVPNHVSTDLNTSGGSITLDNVVGEQAVNTSGGSLDFSNISGNTVAHTSGGSITINDFDGELDANTSGGSIRLGNSTGELNVHTSGGSIVMDGITGSVEATTSGGSIRADIENLGDYLTLHTSGGSINAVVPQGMGLDIELSGNKVNTHLSNFSGETKKDYIKGTLNGGGTPVKMSTSGGSVNLDYRAQASN